MNWSDTFRERYYGPGYVYIAGSLSHRVLKIGTTVNIRQQERRLQRTKYGSIEDWVLLYYVWVSEAGRIEHDTRRRLLEYRQLRMYDKEGHRQKGREIVGCRFGLAQEALSELLTEPQRSEAVKSWRASEYEFGLTAPDLDPPKETLRPPVGIPGEIHTYRSIGSFELSVRTSCCLANDDIRFIGDLVQKTEDELLRTPNFGRKSLNEVKEILSQIDLKLGRPIPDWPPSGLDAISQQAGKLLRPLSDFELSVRSENCLKNDDILYVGELVQRTAADMLRTPNFGRKALNEIRELLAGMNLHLGMDLSRWPMYSRD